MRRNATTSRRSSTTRSSRAQKKKSKLVDSAEVERLASQLSAARARISALEAKPVPYTKEELALFRQPRPPEPRALTASASKSPTARGIPAAARPLLVEATTDFDQRRFAEAEAKFTQALAFDDKQLVTLGNIATTQLEQDKFSGAEATIRRALALAPDDPYTLSLLGLLRYRQNRIEESLDALSRSAQLDPKNAATQNQLGLALAQKSLRAPAEAAFRKAIQLQPNYGQAHFNLAIFYSTAQPPTMELARWHYQKALANGMTPNASLEKTLEISPEAK